MRTRNSAIPKSPQPQPPPKKTPPTRRTAAKASSKSSTFVSASDSSPKPRESKRQAAIKAKQVKIDDNTLSDSHPEDDADDGNVGDDASGVMPQESAGGKKGAKKGTKRTRGPAKGKSPVAQRAKLAEAEETEEEEERSNSGNVDIEMSENVIEIQGKGGSVTDKIEEMNDDKKDAPSMTVTNEELIKDAAEMDQLVVDDVSKPSEACTDKELENETIELNDHLAADVGEPMDVQKGDKNSESETVPGLPENEEQKGIVLDGGGNADSEALTVNETLTVAVSDGNGCQPASSEERNLVENTGEHIKDEGTKNLNTDIIVGTDGQHDETEIKESEDTIIIQVNGDPEELAVMEEDTLDEMAGKDKQIADVSGEICDPSERNSEVKEEANCVDTLAIEDDNTYKDAEEIKKVEGEEDPGIDVGGMSGDGKNYEKDGDHGSNTGGVVEHFKGLESGKNQGDDIITNLVEERQELKMEENLERNLGDFIVDSEKFEEEHREWTAAAKERRIKKEHEIFVRGIDGDTKEDDLRKVFEEIGEVAEVRLHKQSLLNKNKGYAFVRFADKEHVKRALIEIKDPIIGGLSCSIEPSEDNDTLFLGNICNTWTKEAIKQKLKEYGVEGVENVTLVPDAQRGGFSRGFAFLEFSCHDEAVVAYQRLQKPDVIFGHAERTAKVAFAEPLRDPDPDVMLKVKTVFVDGLSSTFDEKYVRKHVKSYGEIERIVLARNMTTAKRKDFGFVHFTTHEAAVACIDGINSTGLGDGNSKTKVKARLSNPLPKTQAVKGGMAGGFRIGFSSSGSASKPGRGVERDGHLYRQGDSARGRGPYQHGYGRSSRSDFSSGYHHDARFSSHVSGQGSRGGFRPHGELPTTHGPFIPNHVTPMSVKGDPSRGIHAGALESFRYDEGFSRHNNQRQFDGHQALGNKRPLYMTDLDAGYGQSSRRPRLNYADPPYPTVAPFSSNGTRIRGPPITIRPHNHYGPPANPRSHNHHVPPPSARPHDYYWPPPSVSPHDYFRPPSSARPPEYYGPPADIRQRPHIGPGYLGGMRPPAFRGNPPYGGGFHH